MTRNNDVPRIMPGSTVGNVCHSAEDAVPLDKRTQDALLSMQKSVKTLNAEAERATTYIREIEDALSSAQPGIERLLLISSNEVGEEHDKDDEPTGANILQCNYVGFARRGGRWGLYAITRTERVWEDEPDELIAETEFKLLRDADRTTKVLAVPRLPELIQMLSDELSEAVKTATQVLEENA